MAGFRPLPFLAESEIQQRGCGRFHAQGMKARLFRTEKSGSNVALPDNRQQKFYRFFLCIAFATTMSE